MLMDRLRLILTPFFSRRLGVVLLLGFSSGLPLALRFHHCTIILT